MGMRPPSRLFITVAFVLLVVFNLMQVAINTTLEKSISELRSQQEIEDSRFKTFRIEQSLIDRTVMDLGFDEVLSAAGTVKLKKLLMKKPASILFIFSSLDCSNCLHTEINRLNQLVSKSTRTSVQILGLGIVESLDRTYLRVIAGGIEPLFPVYRLEHARPLSNDLHTPAIVIVDKAGQIFLSYVASIGDEMKTERFHRTLEMVFTE